MNSAGAPTVLADAELVEQVIQGDVESFGILTQRYERTVLGIAWSALRDLHAAEDVAQASLVLAFQQLASLRDRSRFGPWLMQIVRRQLTDALRQRRRSVAMIGPLSTEIDATEVANREWVEYEHLGLLLSRLPDHERELVGLRFFDGHSMEQIAKITSRSVGTVTKQLSRAIARLRSFYQQEQVK